MHGCTKLIDRDDDDLIVVPEKVMIAILLARLL